MRLTALRTIPGEPGPETSTNKPHWATFHRGLGELAMDVLGGEGPVLAPEAAMAGGEAYRLSELQGLFLFSRADTIYGGSNQIQRNVLGEQVLGLPREPRP
jgi:alkylation response protein AidB-like acyl-CoA dehydrogenase